MKTFRFAAIVTLIVLGAFSAAGQITTITASNIDGADAKKLGHGEIDFLPVTLAGNPIQPRLGGGGVLLYKPGRCLIVNGSITTDVDGTSACTLADTALTNQAHFCYKAQVKDTGTTPNTIFPWIPCMQPTGSTWNLDTQYQPANAPTALVQTGPPGPPGPSGSAGTYPPAGIVAKSNGTADGWLSSYSPNQCPIGQAPTGVNDLLNPVQCQLLPQCPIGSGGLVGAYTDGSGIVKLPVCLGNGPSSFTVPAGATQLQLGTVDNGYGNNTGSFTIAVSKNGGTASNVTVGGKAMPWSPTSNPLFSYGQNDGTSPVVAISGLTQGDIVTTTYVSGTVNVVSGGSPNVDANGWLTNPPGAAGAGGPVGISALGGLGVAPTYYMTGNTSIAVTSSISGMTAGQVAIAAGANSIASSKAIQGTDAALLSADPTTIAAAATGSALCKSSNGGATTAGCTSAGGSTLMPPSYIFTTNGTTVNAINGLTGAVDYTGSDAAVVVNAAMNNIAATCGTLYFKSGIYPINSLTHETTTISGITNLPWYAFGIPANTGTSNQFCAWRFQGEQPTMWAGESGLPLQTDGVIFNITSTAVATATAGNLIAGIWNRPAPLFSGFIVGSQDYFSNITVRFPTNQRGNEVGIYPATAATVDYQNVMTDFAIQYSSLAVPVAGSIGSIGMTSALSNQGNVQNFTNTYSVGFDTGYSFLSEHVGGSDVTSIYSTTACKFGDTFNGASKGVLHAGQIHHLIDQENINGCALGANMTAGSQINLDALDIETAPSGIWTRVNNMTETNAGNSTGIITYSRIVAGGSAPSTLTLWTTGGANFMSLDSKASGGFSRVPASNANTLNTLSGLPTQTSDTVVMNASSGTASPTAVPMPACGTGNADLYNTSTHSWSCVSTGAGGGGALTQIAQTIVAGTSTTAVTFSSIPGTFTNLKLVLNGRFSDSAFFEQARCTFNGDSAGNYDNADIYGGAAGAQAENQVAQAWVNCGLLPAGNAAANTSSQIEMTLAGYAGTTFYKTIGSNVGLWPNSTATIGVLNIVMTAGQWRSTSAITSITITDAGGGHFMAGSTLTLYGVQ